jgi:alanyl-tRNA synthetase
MMTSNQIRQSFLDFFKSKQHTIVPSSSLMPDSPNLLFTNAGMNQFVPIFLGQTKCPYTPGRAADTQKCIRAGGKHNDLDDVGLDTYHHTFFEMLGNWSFGDYFKKEAIAWAWELVIEVWKFPPQRIYATIYQPNKEKNDPADRDEEAWNFWAEKFRSVGLDPAIHIVNGGKKDNFWMMGETGPCGPCTEIHVDLRPGPRETSVEEQIAGAKLVNGSDARCIEIWNNVFIQYNANPDGTFTPLPAQHVDTGMGFERVTSIIQGTKNLTDFRNAKISNYETDIFRPIFDVIEKLSGKKYGSTLPKAGSTGDTEQEKADVAFRVIADHIRTLSFSIADGIQPGNNDRNYVLRRILRRAVRYGRTLGFHEPFFYKLVDVLADTMGEVFPEIRTKKKIVQETIQREEEAFNKTLDRGIELLDADVEKMLTQGEGLLNGYMDSVMAAQKVLNKDYSAVKMGVDPMKEAFQKLRWFMESDAWARHAIISAMQPHLPDAGKLTEENLINNAELLTSIFMPIMTMSEAHELAIRESLKQRIKVLSGRVAFNLYDTYGFPLDLTELMARERGLTVDKEGFEKLMDEQKKRSQAAQKKEVISVSQFEGDKPTEFVGYELLDIETNVIKMRGEDGKPFVTLARTPCYAEMGGQVGDVGVLIQNNQKWKIRDTRKSGEVFMHLLEGIPGPQENVSCRVIVDSVRRDAIQRHHTVTHLLHWALHEVASKEASQKGSFVGPDKLTFDFNSAPLTPAQVADIEKLVNERILENAGVSWTEVAHADVKNRKDVMQFFGDKYGDTVRVVQIGGGAGKLDGYSMELCGGTHTRATGEIGLFRIVSEAAVAAGVRRIEAVAGLTAYGLANEQLQLIRSIAGKINSPVGELEKKVEALLAQQKDLEKSLRTAIMRNAAQTAAWLLTRATEVNGIPLITQQFPDSDGDYLQAIVDAVKSQFKGVIVVGGYMNGSVTLIANVSPEFTAKVQAGKIIQTIAPIVGGKGGGKPDNARGGGKDATKLDEALAKAKSLLA